MNGAPLPVPVCDGLLRRASSAAIRGIAPELAHAMRTRQIHRTETEMRCSVLDAVHFPTHAARYWQSVREQCVMLAECTRLFFDQRRLLLRRARNEWLLRWFGWFPFMGEALRIELDESIVREQFMRQEAEDRVREILLWEKIKAEETAADPTFDRENVDTHQLISYTKMFALRAAHSDAERMSGGELDNLLGQLRASVALAEERGVLPQVLEGLPKEVCLPMLSMVVAGLDDDDRATLAALTSERMPDAA